MEQITINATKRTISGKSVSQLRKNGILPAVVYGHNTKSENIEVNENEFLKAFRQAGESTIITLSLEGKNTPVLIHDVHNHYLKDTPIHIDFYAVNMSERLTAHVPLHFIGESFAVKNLGGTLAKNMTEVEVECLPADLPQHIEVDIATLATFDDAIRVSDLKVSDKVEIKAAAEELIVAVTAPRSEEELKELEEKPVDADVTAVEGVVKPTDTPAAAEGAEAPKGESKAEAKPKAEGKKE